MLLINNPKKNWASDTIMQRKQMVSKHEWKYKISQTLWWGTNPGFAHTGNTLSHITSPIISILNC